MVGPPDDENRRDGIGAETDNSAGRQREKSVVRRDKAPPADEPAQSGRIKARPQAPDECREKRRREERDERKDIAPERKNREAQQQRHRDQYGREKIRRNRIGCDASDRVQEGPVRYGSLQISGLSAPHERLRNMRKRKTLATCCSGVFAILALRPSGTVFRRAGTNPDLGRYGLFSFSWIAALLRSMAS